MFIVNERTLERPSVSVLIHHTEKMLHRSKAICAVKKVLAKVAKKPVLPASGPNPPATQPSSLEYSSLNDEPTLYSADDSFNPSPLYPGSDPQAEEARERSQKKSQDVSKNASESKKIRKAVTAAKKATAGKGPLKKKVFKKKSLNKKTMKRKPSKGPKSALKKAKVATKAATRKAFKGPKSALKKAKVATKAATRKGPLKKKVFKKKSLNKKTMKRKPSKGPKSALKKAKVATKAATRKGPLKTKVFKKKAVGKQVMKKKPSKGSKKAAKKGAGKALKKQQANKKGATTSKNLSDIEYSSCRLTPCRSTRLYMNNLSLGMWRMWKALRGLVRRKTYIYRCRKEKWLESFKKFVLSVTFIFLHLYQLCYTHKLSLFPDIHTNERLGFSISSAIILWTFTAPNRIVQQRTHMDIIVFLRRLTTEGDFRFTGPHCAESHIGNRSRQRKRKIINLKLILCAVQCVGKNPWTAISLLYFSPYPSAVGFAASGETSVKLRPKPIKILEGMIKDASTSSDADKTVQSFVAMIRKLQRERDRLLNSSLRAAAANKLVDNKKARVLRVRRTRNRLALATKEMKGLETGLDKDRERALQAQLDRAIREEMESQKEKKAAPQRAAAPLRSSVATAKIAERRRAERLRDEVKALEVFEKLIEKFQVERYKEVQENIDNFQRQQVMEAKLAAEEKEKEAALKKKEEKAAASAAAAKQAKALKEEKASEKKPPAPSTPEDKALSLVKKQLSRLDTLSEEGADVSEMRDKVQKLMRFSTLLQKAAASLRSKVEPETKETSHPKEEKQTSADKSPEATTNPKASSKRKRAARVKPVKAASEELVKKVENNEETSPSESAPAAITEDPVVEDTPSKKAPQARKVRRAATTPKPEAKAKVAEKKPKLQKKLAMKRTVKAGSMKKAIATREKALRAKNTSVVKISNSSRVTRELQENNRRVSSARDEPSEVGWEAGTHSPMSVAKTYHGPYHLMLLDYFDFKALHHFSTVLFQAPIQIGSETAILPTFLWYHAQSYPSTARSPELVKNTYCIGFSFLLRQPPNPYPLPFRTFSPCNDAPFRSWLN
eukprot:gene10660-7406_t